MTFDPVNPYAGRRLPTGTTALREGRPPMPERLLQAIWQHQRLRRNQLKTLDGRKVRVIHPGFNSVEGGPDFRGALIQIGTDPPRSGDVEVDLKPNGWRAHGHDRNPAFRNVVLHVAWNGEPVSDAPPLLLLQHSLDASIAELSLWLEHLPTELLPERFQGKCSAPLRDLNEGQLTHLLAEAARVRLQSKASHFRARAQQSGWEESLWEGLFRALGYKHNTWPMQCLSETRSRWMQGKDSVFALQARLLGISGLLPSEPNGKDGYIRKVWDQWWRERDEFEDCLLPRTAWKFHGLRPANHPQRRLALAAHWLLTDDFVTRIERWSMESKPDNRLLSSLAEVFQVKRDEFWSWHWTFQSARSERAQPLLGEKRVTDLAVNVVLPWLWAQANDTKNSDRQKESERRYFAWPAAEDNSVLRLARKRLLGGSGRKVLRTAAVQQGLMQVIRDFCEHSDAVCDQCRFPELVQQWHSASDGQRV